MALHPDFPESPHAILDPALRWFPADEALRDTSMDKLMPPLAPQLRRKVKEWRDSGYAGGTDTSRSLLDWWFNTPHLQPRADGAMAEFQYYFAQREALETIIYLYDVVGVQDKYDMMRFDGSGMVSEGMFDESWRRFVVKMATGTGKTKVLSLALAWSFYHKLYEPESQLARNFLVIAPNIIVLDRIYKDFQGLRIFFEDPVIPGNGVDGRNWRDDFQLTLHVQDEVRITRSTGNIFLTNIHRVYAGDDIPASPEDEHTMDYFLGKRPSGATTDSKVDLGMIVRDINELMVLNDEAHHIHDPRMAWFKSIEDIHNRLKQKGAALSLQVDVTATPKHNNGGIFVQTVADYPLVEAISQNVVKHPVLPDAASRAKLVERQRDRRAGQPEHGTQPVGAGGHQNRARNLQDGDQCVDRAGQGRCRNPRHHQAAANSALRGKGPGLPHPEKKRLQQDHRRQGVGTGIRPLSGRVRRCGFLRQELPGGALQAGLRERGRGYFQLLPGFSGQAVRQAYFHRRNQRPGRPGRAAQDATAAPMVRRHQPGAGGRGLRLRVRGPGKFREIQTCLLQAIGGWLQGI